jgi:hypothetical protein
LWWRWGGGGGCPGRPSIVKYVEVKDAD